MSSDAAVTGPAEVQLADVQNETQKDRKRRKKKVTPAPGRRQIQSRKRGTNESGSGAESVRIETMRLEQQQRFEQERQLLQLARQIRGLNQSFSIPGHQSCNQTVVAGSHFEQRNPEIALREIDRLEEQLQVEQVTAAKELQLLADRETEERRVNQQRIEAEERRLVQLRTEERQRQRELAELNLQREQLGRRMVRHQQTLAEFEQNRVEHEKLMAEHERTMQTHQRTMTEQQRQIDAGNRKLVSRERDLQRERRRQQQVFEQLESTTEQLESTRKNLSKQSEQLAADRRRLAGELRTLEGEREQLESTQKDLRKQAKQREADHRRLADELKTLERERKQLKSTNQKQESMHQQLESTRKDLKHQLQQLEADRNRLADELRKLEQERQRQEQLQRAATDAATDSAWFKNRKGLIVAFSPRSQRVAAEYTGSARRDEKGRFELTHGAAQLDSFSETLLRECRKSNELTVEVVFETNQRDQSGPARIVSFSSDTAARNFTIGQDNSQLVIRLRTDRTGDNGTDPEISVAGLRHGRMQHLIVTYKPGELVCFLDGEELLRTDQIQGDFSTWTAQHFILGDEWTGDRDWTGRIERFAVFSRSLDDRELRDHIDRVRREIR